MDTVENLREALASAQQLIAAQQARLQRQELVLGGLEALRSVDEPAAALERAFDLLRGALNFRRALLLEPAGAGYVCLAATDPTLVGAPCPDSALFARTVRGAAGAVIPDLSGIPEWRGSALCDQAPAGGLLAPIATQAGAGLLVVCADTPGAYSSVDLSLVLRMSLLMSQTLAACHRRRLAEAVRRSEVEREAAVRANEVKSRFFANMSHEIRTPLNGVVAVADLLARTELAPPQQEMAALILDSGRMLEHLLNDVLDFTNIESGHLILEAGPVRLADELRSVFELFAVKADAKGLALRIACDPAADDWFEADAQRVRQVLSNLLSNAVKFTERGGVEVELAVEPAPAGALVRVAVRDSGCGFDPQTAERLFERFEQADGSITRPFGGAGLGLPIARQLARLMGGDVRGWSTPGDGAVFEFTFTAARAAAPELAAPAAEPTGLGQALRVLVVDDNSNNRRIIGMVLELDGVDCTFAGDGAEALDLMSVQAFDLVLMDLQMPVMDGLTAMRRIRERERAGRRPPMPIIAVSANAMPHHVAEALQAGADAHVAKPVDPATLLSTIAAFCTADADSEPAVRQAG